MRIVVLASSPYSETGCAMASRLAQLGHVPVGALSLSSWDRATLVRKIGQWGFRDSLRFARAKLSPRKTTNAEQVRNPYLASALQRGGKTLRNLHEVGLAYGFPVKLCAKQNSDQSIAQLRQWAPDLAIFTGGEILRAPLLAVPRLGVLNSHLALLPEIRGMSSPEWSLLSGVPLGVTIHFVDDGIDTGKVLLRREFRETANCTTLTDLRNRMIAFGLELLVEVVAGLDRNAIAGAPQAQRDQDHQYFVMHERLKALAARKLAAEYSSASASGG